MNLLLKLNERLHGLLDWCFFIHDVHVVWINVTLTQRDVLHGRLGEISRTQIDGFDAQGLETFLERLLAVLWRCVAAQAVLLEDETELGGQKDIVPLAGSLEPSANSSFAQKVKTVQDDEMSVPH